MVKGDDEHNGGDEIHDGDYEGGDVGDNGDNGDVQ